MNSIAFLPYFTFSNDVSNYCVEHFFFISAAAVAVCSPSPISLRSRFALFSCMLFFSEFNFSTFICLMCTFFLCCLLFFPVFLMCVYIKISCNSSIYTVGRQESKVHLWNMAKYTKTIFLDAFFPLS